MIDKKEFQKIIVEWNSNKTDYPKNSSIKDLFEETAEKYPDKIALIYEDQKLTYGNLNKTANQLAAYLLDYGICRGEYVGASMEKSIDFIIAILAILKAGAIYVPIDANYPDERKEFFLNDCKIRTLIVQEKFLNRFSKENLKEVCLEKIKNQLSKYSKENLKIPVNALDVAYVNYTSGTTGSPKGVEVYNRGVVRLVKNTGWVKILKDDCFLQIANTSFDATTFEVWGALLNGAALCIYPYDKIAPEKIAELIKKEKITHALFTARIFDRMIDEEIDSLKSLSYIFSVGEVMSPIHAKKAFSELQNTSIINGYGPTENTTFSTTYTVKSEKDIEKEVPIGRPISNSSVYILDKDLKPVSIGSVGELYVGGDGVAKGYLNNTEANKKVFIDDPFSKETGPKMYCTGDLGLFLPNGDILFRGRIDKQVKIRGFRIELKEIEMAARRIKGVKECVCIVSADEPEKKHLALYVEGKTTSKEIREAIALTLPYYSIPDYIIVLDKLPLNPSGKVDRKALSFPKKFLEKQKTDKVKGVFEKVVAGLWKEVLKLEKIDREDDFFNIGGDSISAVELTALLSREFQKEIPPDLIFKHTTLKEFTKKIQDLLSPKGKPKKTIQKQFWTWREKEAKLDPKIGKEQLKKPSKEQYTNPQNVFLTGSSGFVGAFILKSLLDDTGAKIYCLVRGKSLEEGFLRIKSNLAAYEIWQESYRERIVPVVGNLEEKFLGVAPDVFKTLSEKIDSIFHVGANVNHSLSYENLKLSNVFGTKEIIRLSMHMRSKPLHFVSTIDVFEPDGDIKEEEDISRSLNLLTGYAESKWVAEELVKNAREKGLFANIYRLARVLGSSVNGSGPVSDFLWREIQACILLRSFPLISLDESMTCADLTAKALVHISKKMDFINKEYHLFNPKKVSYQALFKYLQNYGYKLKGTDLKLWKAKLIEEAKKNKKLQGLVALFSKHDLSAFSQKSNFLCTNVNQALQGSSIVFKDADEKLFRFYLDYYVKIGFLPKP